MQSVLWIWLLVSSAYAARKLESVFEWKYIDYEWDSPEQKNYYIKSGDYDYKSIVPIDVDKAKDGRIFITAIRNQGVPASLATVTRYIGPSGPLLRPYPNWSWFNKSSCDGITSVYRVAMDECNKLYVLDTGMIGNNYTCPAQILIFDLGNDQLINRIQIPNNVSKNKAGVGKLVTPVIEVSGPNCQLEAVFMADVLGGGLVVMNKDRIFRLDANIFEADPEYKRVKIAGESFDMLDSLMGLALAPKRFEGDSSDLFLRPFSSLDMYSGNSQVISRSTFGGAIQFKQARGMMPSQASAMGMSSQGVLFFGLTKEVAIGCWNRNQEMLGSNVDIAVTDKERLQFASGLKVLPASRTNGFEEIWVLTNRLQKIMNGSQNFTEINFRVMRSTTDKLIKDTQCEPSSPFDVRIQQQTL